jgi:hypothetical protein
VLRARAVAFDRCTSFSLNPNSCLGLRARIRKRGKEDKFHG